MPEQSPWREDVNRALLTLQDPGPSARAPKNGEQLLIERALLQAQGDKTRAARLIGWHRTKLYRRLRRYGIPYGFGRGG